MNTLSLHLFGYPRLEWTGKNLVGVMPKKALAILIYLAVTGKVHEREWLASLFWSEIPTPTALKNLRDTLPALRKIVGQHLISTRQTVTFNQAEPYFLDVDVFQAALRLDPPEPERAVALYRGEFLAGFHIPHAPLFEDWMTIQREHLQELAVRTMDDLVEHYIARQEWAAGLGLTQRLLALEPWRETAHRQRMLLLAHTDQRGAALEQYTACRKILAEEFGVGPTEQTEALYQRIRANQLEDLPAPTVPLPRHNLPRSLTTFFGREDELTRVTQLVRDPECPLITLIGEGGIGKTRLALATARQALAHFPDGVWFVPLAGLPPTPDETTAADSLARAIGTALEIQFAGPALPIQQIIQRIRDRNLLLVLDNFEHLMAGSSFVVDLLEQAAHLTLLVASRERLHVLGETVVRLHGLPVPAATQPTAEALTYSSLQLFAERAARTSPDFVLNESNLMDVVRICRVLEGLPLGIEMAAATTEQQSSATIAASLETGLAHLASTLRGVPDRQRSLQAVFDYSWRFLSADEARTLARCAVFRGGFSGAAASAVTGANFAQLASLINKSLLRSGPHDRFEIHELVRQCAGEKLVQLPSSSTPIEDQHCDYYLGWLGQHQEDLENDSQVLHEMQNDLPNLRAAWDWGVRTGRVAALTSSVQALALLYRLGGLFREARLTFDDAIVHLPVRTGERAATRLRGLLMLEQSFFYEHLAHLSEAQELAQEAIRLSQALDDVYIEAAGYQRLASIHMAQGQVEASLAACQHGLALAHAARLPRLEAMGLAGMGVIMQARGEPAQALTYHIQALAITARHRYQRFESIITGNLANMYARLGQVSLALTYARNALRLSRLIGDKNSEGMTLLHLGDVYCSVGDNAQAYLHYNAAHKIFSDGGNQRYESLTLAGLGLTLFHQGEIQKGYEISQQSRQLAQQTGDPRAEASALVVSGQALAALGDLSGAQVMYEQALNRLPPGEGAGHTMLNACLAELYLKQKRVEIAVELVESILPKLDLLPIDPPLTEPFQIYRACYRVLVGVGDSRAEDVYQSAYEKLETLANQIEGEPMRQAYRQYIEELIRR